MKKILLAAVLMGLTLTACTNYDYYKIPYDKMEEFFKTNLK